MWRCPSISVQEVGLVDEEDGVDPLLPEVLDVRGHRVEDRAAVAFGERPRARQS